MNSKITRSLLPKKVLQSSLNSTAFDFGNELKNEKNEGGEGGGVGGGDGPVTGPGDQTLKFLECGRQETRGAGGEEASRSQSHEQFVVDRPRQSEKPGNTQEEIRPRVAQQQYSSIF